MSNYLAYSAPTVGSNFNIDIPTSFGNTSAGVSSTASTVSTSGQGMFSAGNLLNTISTLGGTASQLIQAFKGQQVIVQDGNGGTKDITAQLVAVAKTEAETNETTPEEILRIVQESLSNSVDEVAKKDNTLLYVGVGVGGLVLATGLYLAFK